MSFEVMAKLAIYIFPPFLRLGNPTFFIIALQVLLHKAPGGHAAVAGDQRVQHRCQANTGDEKN